MNDVFPAIVYILCFLTSTACAWLLLSLAAAVSLIWGFIWDAAEDDR